MADKIHCIRKTLRLMPQEAEMLAKKAGESGMCEADYLRLLISQNFSGFNPGCVSDAAFGCEALHHVVVGELCVVVLTDSLRYS